MRGKRVSVKYMKKFPVLIKFEATIKVRVIGMKMRRGIFFFAWLNEQKLFLFFNILITSWVGERKNFFGNYENIFAKFLRC